MKPRCTFLDAFARAVEDPDYACTRRAVALVDFDDREPRHCCASHLPTEDEPNVVHIERLK